MNPILARMGIDPSKLPKSKPIEPRILLLDADGIVYTACSSAKTIGTALRRFCTGVLEQQFLTNSTEVRLHLTASNGYKGGRGLVPSFKPYQGQRKGAAKPALLEPLRELLATERAIEMGMPEEWYVNLNRYWEADDTCVMESYIYKDKALVVSPDKDLRLTIFPYWEANKGAVSVLSDRFGYIAEGAGSYPIGHGLKYFWLQMLMGDTADNIRGLDKLDGRNCGRVSAMQYLEPITCETEAANRIIWEYARHKQDVLAEAQLLWMRRHEQDCAYEYFMELDLEPALKQWVQGLHKYHQEYIKTRVSNDSIHP